MLLTDCWWCCRDSLARRTTLTDCNEASYSIAKGVFFLLRHWHPSGTRSFFRDVVRWCRFAQPKSVICTLSALILVFQVGTFFAIEGLYG